MSASLLSSYGELCVVDQSKPPFGRSIRSLIFSWASWSDLAVMRYDESSTNPIDDLFLLAVHLMSGAL